MEPEIPEKNNLKLKVNWTCMNKSRVLNHRVPPLKSRLKKVVSVQSLLRMQPLFSTHLAKTTGIIFPVSYNPLHVGKLLNGAFKCPRQFVKPGDIFASYMNSGCC